VGQFDLEKIIEETGSTKLPSAMKHFWSSPTQTPMALGAGCGAVHSIKSDMVI